MTVLNGNLGNDRTTTNRLQVCENNWVRKISRVARADGSVEELDREIGEEQTIVGRTRRKDGG